VLAPGSVQKPCSQGVVELPPGVGQRRGTHPQALGAQDADGDAEQEQQLEGAAVALGVGVDPGGVGGGRGVSAGELAVGGEQQAVAAVGEVGEGVEALEQRRGVGRPCGCRRHGDPWRLAAGCRSLAARHRLVDVLA
jgi:hypothetical protein